MTCSRMKKPAPGLPSMFSFGTRQSRNSSSQNGHVLSPSFSIGSPTWKPGVSVGTRNAVIPAAPPSVPVLA